MQFVNVKSYHGRAFGRVNDSGKSVETDFQLVTLCVFVIQFRFLQTHFAIFLGRDVYREYICARQQNINKIE